MRDSNGHGTQQIFASATIQTGLSLMSLFTAICVIMVAVSDAFSRAGRFQTKK